MTKHTPGPWVAVGTWVEHPGKVADICTCATRMFGQEKLGRTYDEECANARLIAAAPEMLEALREIAAASSSSRRLAINMAAIERIASAAIAKAEGRS
jgi:glutamate dehydrogenase/leucine dehydrogenase